MPCSQLELQLVKTITWLCQLDLRTASYGPFAPVPEPRFERVPGPGPPADCSQSQQASAWCPSSLTSLVSLRVCIDYKIISGVHGPKLSLRVCIDYNHIQRFRQVQDQVHKPKM